MKDYSEIEIINCENNDERVLKLKEQTKDMTNWRRRVDACKQLMHLNCQQSKDILVKIIKNDPVYKVREAAHFGCKVLKVKMNKELIELKNKPLRCYDKGIENKLGHVRNVLNNEFTYEEFKVRFKELYPIEYDVIEGSQDKFDKWLRNKLSSFNDYMMYGDLKNGGIVTYVRFSYPNIYATIVNSEKGLVPIKNIKVHDKVYLKDGITLVPVMSVFHPRFKALNDEIKRQKKKQEKIISKQRQRDETYRRLSVRKPEIKIGSIVSYSINGKNYYGKVSNLILNNRKIIAYKVDDSNGNTFLFSIEQVKLAGVKSKGIENKMRG